MCFDFFAAAASTVTSLTVRHQFECVTSDPVLCMEGVRGGKGKSGSEGVVSIDARAQGRAHAMWTLVCFRRLLPKSIDGGRKMHRHCSQSCPQPYSAGFQPELWAAGVI